MKNFDPGRPFEEFTSDMRYRASSKGGGRHFAWVLLCECNKVWNVTDWGRWVGFRNERGAHQASDHGHVGVETVFQLCMEGGVDGVFGHAHEKRVAVHRAGCRGSSG